MERLIRSHIESRRGIVEGFAGCRDRSRRWLSLLAGLATWGLWAWAAVIAAGAPLSAQAPSDTVRTDSVYDVEPVVVRDARRMAAPGGVSAIMVSPDSLSIRAVASVEDALRELPFVLVRQNSRGMAEISVRGSDSRQVAVLLDGVPLTLAWDHRTDPAVIPLIGARSITFARGLPSVLGGPNVLGGVVEVDVAKGGSLAPVRDELRLTAGMDDAGYRALGVAGTASQRVAESRVVVRAGAGYRSRDGFALPEDVPDAGAAGGLRSNSDLAEASGFGALRWEGQRGGWLSLSGSAYRAERGVPPELHVEEPRLWRYPEEWQVVTAASLGTGQRGTPWGRGDLEASLGLTRGRQDIAAYASAAYDAVVETESGDDRTLTLRLLGDHTLGRTGELRGALTYADVAHLEVLDGQDRHRYRQRLWSVGSEIAWRLPKATRLSVGGALDGADTPESGGRPPLGTLWAWGGRAGVSTLALRPDLQLHLSASSRARFPALRELYSGALGRFEPNADLAPERLDAGELGVTWKQARYEVQATAFRHRLSDAVVRTTTTEGNFRRINRDEINSAGIEVLAGGSLAGAEILGDLMVQDVTVRDRSAGSAPMRPEHMPELTAGLDVDAPLPLDIRGVASLDHTGRQYCVHPDLGTDVELDASTRLDLAVRRTWSLGEGLWRGVRANLGVDNVADTVAYDQCGMPQPGRTVRVGVELF